ncbi:MAG TPA: ChbG/HpnK family deacetylase [Candidatus Dormibacteraeota bacterium]|nr:ChbG/HpnK family deacetylase [Candidatus Dormibacteraeota bacterium]
MLRINADDWGRSMEETEAALAAFKAGTVTATSAMVFMKDSERSSEIARERNLDVGLHLNLTESFTGQNVSGRLREAQERVGRFLRRHRYAPMLYHPGLRREFHFAYEAQAEEFVHLYGQAPARVDGHLHMHQCANLVLEGIIPRGLMVRRNFSFWPGEKSWLNRSYRSVMDWWLGRRYRLTDYFFSLETCLKSGQLSRVGKLASASSVELMTHPVYPAEHAFLTGPAGDELVREVRARSSRCSSDPCEQGKRGVSSL